jgi:hypothetical protein
LGRFGAVIYVRLLKKSHLMVLLDSFSTKIVPHFFEFQHDSHWYLVKPLAKEEHQLLRQYQG